MPFGPLSSAIDHARKREDKHMAQLIAILPARPHARLCEYLGDSRS